MSRRIDSLAIVLVLAAGLALAPSFADVGEAGPETPAQVKPRSQMMPHYPATATFARVPATVNLVVRVAADGEVEDAFVVDCDRPGLGFEETAADAVRRWKFEPARRADEPVASTTAVRLVFSPPRPGARADERLVRGMVAPIGDAVRFGELLAAGPAQREAEMPTFSPAVTDQQANPMRVEFPNCGPRGTRCMYDRSKLNQPSGDPAPLPTPIGPTAGR